MSNASKQLEAAATLAQENIERGTSPWRDAWHRLAKNRLAVASGAFLVALVLACFVGPFLGVQHYEAQDLALSAAPPGAKHWFGTDILGRDIFSRVLFGGRISLLVGAMATGVSLLIGVLYGAVAGYFGGKLDSVMMRTVDILYALPFTVFVILLMVLFGRNIFLLFFVIGCVEWLTMARIVRGQVQALRQQEFIEAARALGLRKRRIIVRHMIPNVMGVVVVYATLTVPGVIMLESFLSFLGFGVQPPMSSWGTLINEGAHSMEEYPWLLFFPALFFSATLFSLNFLGDGLRDALDVRASKD
jgi:oligopeptide transport system permease protein